MLGCLLYIGFFVRSYNLGCLIFGLAVNSRHGPPRNSDLWLFFSPVKAAGSRVQTPPCACRAVGSVHPWVPPKVHLDICTPELGHLVTSSSIRGWEMFSFGEVILYLNPGDLVSSEEGKKGPEWGSSLSYRPPCSHPHSRAQLSRSASWSSGRWFWGPRWGWTYTDSFRPSCGFFGRAFIQKRMDF